MQPQRGRARRPGAASEAVTRLSVASIMKRKGGFNPRSRPKPDSEIGKLYDQFIEGGLVSVVGSGRAGRLRVYRLRDDYEMNIVSCGNRVYRLDRETWP